MTHFKDLKILDSHLIYQYKHLLHNLSYGEGAHSCSVCIHMKTVIGNPNVISRIIVKQYILLQCKKNLFMNDCIIKNNEICDIVLRQ